MAHCNRSKLDEADSWDIIAGVAAAVSALVLHLLHIVETDIVFTIVLVLLALLLIRDLRRESHDERLSEDVKKARSSVEEIQLALQPTDTILIGPRNLRAESQRFAESSRGEMVWFNVCFLMFKSQEVFDLLLRPAIENPLVESVQFISNAAEKDLWMEQLLPKINDCSGRQKVAEPRWCDLPETISFILADTEPSGETEALLSFWGEPFMARTTNKQVPRYIFRVQRESDLISRFVELARQHRMGE